MKKTLVFSGKVKDFKIYLMALKQVGGMKNA